MPPPSYFPLRWESTGDQWWYASPIDWAAANGHYDLVRELLHLDTNLLIKLTSLRRIRRLETLWDDAHQVFYEMSKCRSHVARNLLMECESKMGPGPCPNPNQKPHNSLIRAGYGGWLLYTAASAGDMDFVKELLDRYPLLVFGEGEYGVTDILYAAARSKNSEVFKLLLEFSISQRSIHGNGEELEGKTEENLSVFRWEMMNRAVHAAARGGNVEMLRELLKDCSDVLAYRDAQGSTVLHTAAGRGQVEVVKDLLASYDIITATDNQGNTALSMAAYSGYLTVFEVLISASPSSASLTNNYGDTFLHMTVAGFRTPGFRRLDCQIQLMKKLVSGKVVDMYDIVNVKNNDGRTALHMAVIENVQSDLVELLMTMPGIDLNICDTEGMTPLDLLKQRPKSASSEILIKRLISAGGISNCQDHMARSALVSHLKMHSIGGSPGTSFRIPDAEIFLYTGVENASDACWDPSSMEYGPWSSELSKLDSAAGSYSVGHRKSNSFSKAARRLKILLRWPKHKEKRGDGSKLGDNDSLVSYDSKLGDTPTSLRQKFSELSSFPNNKRVLSGRNDLPSPSTRRRFSSGLMHGVIQAWPQFADQSPSPSSPYSGSSIGSPLSTDKRRTLDIGSEVAEPSSSNNSFSGGKEKMIHKQSSFNKRLMNQYFCFGAQGLAVEDPVHYTRPRQSYRKQSSLMT